MKKIVLFCISVLGAGLFLTADFAVGQDSDESAYVINQDIEDLNGDIDDKKNDIKKIQQKQEEFTKAIQTKQKEKASLNNQLAILDNRLAKAELDIELVETQIERTGLEILRTNMEIVTKTKEMDNEKADIENVLRLLYKKDNITSLEILLLNESFSDFLSEVKYLEDVNETIGDSVEALKKLKQQLEKERVALDNQRQEEIGLKAEMEKKKLELSSEQETKVLVLGQVNKSERDYQRLLEQAKKEQEDAAAEIASLEKLVRAKLAQLEGRELGFNDNGFVWPVPRNVITSYFHDPDYPFRYIFEHPAVDVRCGQGTTLKAAASGYVARAKDGGKKGYSYIMLIHGDGLSTVYGHVSKIHVEEDEYVVQGQVIGQTGGMPGTSGAGSLTTGPHLHFEVRLNGIPVDPLAYLP